MTTQIKLLGKALAEIDGQLSPVEKSAKGLALLAYLLVTRQSPSREEVADLLWDAISTAKSLNNLRQLLSRMRNWLPDLQITATSVAYKASGFVDLYELEAGLTVVHLPTLDAALQLYQGELLAGLYLPDAPRFNEWLLVEREQGRQRVVVAFDRLCQGYAQEQNWVKGIAAAQRWLALDELNEVAVCHLLQFLAASGQIELALQQYEISIPYLRNNDFTGRRESLLHLANLLLPQAEVKQQRAVAVTGMGGLGKTQIAVEFCYRYGRYFPGGVYWLSFADSGNVVEEVAAIGGERGMGLYREADDLRQADKVGRVTKVWQEPIPRLLIFDNCEEEALLAKWLPVTGGCSVLLTSRRANWTRELQIAEWPLPALDMAESVRFLQTVVPALTTVAATDIAEELGHLPLALHLAGSFLRRYGQITADQYLSQLRDKALLTHPSLQGRGVAFSPTGHELDVARTFAVNWEQLVAANETDAIALRLLGCAAQFASGEPLPRDLLLTTVVTNELDVMQQLLAEDGLARLISLGFIRPNGEFMLSIHRLVVAFVQTMLAAETSVAMATTVADTIWQRLKRQWEPSTVLDRLVIASTQVQHVMEVELAKGTTQAIHLAHVWGRHLMDISDFARARTYLEQALALCEKVYGMEQPETADILIDLGTLIWKTDSDKAAWPYYQRAHAIYQQTFGDIHVKTANSLTTMAILHARTGNYEAAVAHYQQALAVYEQVLPPNHQTVGLNLYNLAVAYRRLGNYEVALSHYETSLYIHRTQWSDDNPHILTTLSSIGLIRFLLGDYEAAYDYFQQALQGRQARLGDQHHHTSLSLTHVGVALGFLGNYEMSIDYLKRALDIREKAFGSDHPQLVYTLSYLGYMLPIVGELETAHQMLTRGLAIHEAKQIANEQTAETLTFLADVLMQLGEMDKAHTCLVKALAIWEHRLAQSKTATAHIRFGEWHEAQGDNDAACAHYEKALVILHDQVRETHHELRRVRGHWQRLRGEG